MSLIFKINELGPIKNTQFEFKPYCIFTGESNLGKSYSAFLIAAFFKLIEEEHFKVFVDDLYDFTKLSKTIAEGKSDTILFERKGFQEYLYKNIPQQIAYLTGNELFDCDVEVETELDDIIIEVNSPKSRKSLLGKNVPFVTVDGTIEKIAESYTEQNEESLISFFHMKIYRELLKRIFKRNWLGTIILPPGRGAVYPSSFTMKKNIANTGMYNDFLERMDEVTSPSALKNEHDELIDKLLLEIFQGKISVDKDKFYYDFNGQRIPLQAAASSIKELAPMHLILQKGNLNEKSVLLEEPEAHLHPNLQRKIASLLAVFINGGGFLQVTTHSDYFLNQTNNLIKMAVLKKKETEGFSDLKEKVEKYGIQEGMYLDKEKVGAYYFEKREDGSVEIKEQNLTKEAIPFDTFEKTVNGMMDETDLINESFYSE
jgi:predicted ATPase